jgi:hypothetical protein
MKTLFKFLFAAACISLLVTCQKPDQAFIDDSSANELKCANIDKKFEKGEIFNLKGLALYKTWKVVGGKVIQDVKWDAVGTIEFLGDGNFTFTFSELRPNGNAAAFNGKIDNNGKLKFQFPSPLFVDPVNGPFYITDVIKQHACATIWGEGINEGTLVFHGKFNGNKFTATAIFNATVGCPCPSNDMFDPCLLNANGVVDLYWIFGYDFEVVKDHNKDEHHNEGEHHGWRLGS